MERRRFLKLGVGAAAGMATSASSSATLRVIDTHIHLFDPRRPGGIPWPEKSDPIFHPALPERYAGLAKPFGIVGAIAVEASPLAADNDWVLNLIANQPIMVGFVGDLAPGTSGFAADLDRLHANPLFLGIRCGNLWNRDLPADAANPACIADLRRLAAAGLAMDSANPDANLVEAILRIAQQVPDLRIVIDHLPHAVLPAQPAALDRYWANLKTLGANPRVFVKLSEIPVREQDRLVTDLAPYRPHLDALWDLFGEDRVLFGSDWPNSDHVATFAETFGIVRRYVAEKGPSATEKFFHRNSVAAYRWQPRTLEQRSLD